MFLISWESFKNCFPGVDLYMPAKAWNGWCSEKHSQHWKQRPTLKEAAINKKPVQSIKCSEYRETENQQTVNKS